MKLTNERILKVIEVKAIQFPMLIEDLREDKVCVYDNYENKSKPTKDQYTKIDILNNETIRDQRVMLIFIDGFYTEHYVIITEYDLITSGPDYMIFIDKIEKEGIITYSFSSKVFGVQKQENYMLFLKPASDMKTVENKWVLKI